MKKKRKEKTFYLIKLVPDLVVEEQIALALHDIAQRGLADDVVIAFEPLIAVEPYEACVVAGLKRAHVIHHGE